MQDTARSTGTARRLRCLAFAGALLAPSAALGAGVSIDAATAEQSAAASDKFRAGIEALEAQKLDAALDLFRKSYDIVASPNSRLMIGRVLGKMNKPAEAYEELAAAAAEADLAAARNEKYRKTATSAHADLDVLRAKIGLVVVNLDATVSVGGREIAKSELGRPIVVAPGTTEVVVRLPSGEEQRRSVEVKGGQESRVDVAPPAAKGAAATAAAPVPCAASTPPPERSGVDQKTLAWVAGGVGLAGLAAFAVFGALDDKAFSDLEKKCAGGVCPRSASGDAETGRTYQTLANVGLGVGAVGLATGLVLLFTAPSHPAERTAISRMPEVSVGPRSVAFSGRF